MRVACGVVAVTATLLPQVFAIPSSEWTHALHEKRHVKLRESEWIQVRRSDSFASVPVRIGLTQRNLEHAERYIMDVASPESPNFGKHWTAEEVANTFAPSDETNDLVIDWIVTSGIDRDRISHSTGRNWLQFDASIEELEDLLRTKYHDYEHVPTGEQHISCDDYSIPQHVRPHVDFIMPTVQLGGLQRLPNHELHRRAFQKREQYESEGVSNVVAGHAGLQFETFDNLALNGPGAGLTGSGNCSDIRTIDCLRALYNFPAGSTNSSDNQLGIAEWANYLYQPDLQDFFYIFTDPVIPNDTYPEFISIDGGKKVDAGIQYKQAFYFNTSESAIDFQIGYSIVYPQGLRLYQIGDGVNVDSVGTFNIFLDALDASYCTYQGGDDPQLDPAYPDPFPGGYKGNLQCGGAPKSNVISISYGQEEARLTTAYMERQCNEWMKLALQGTSVIIASGDSGVANRFNLGFPNECLEADSLTQSKFAPRFNPSFPVSCPWVTSVGATDLLTGSIDGGEKAVVAKYQGNQYLDYYSGGGFSNVFTMPSYQSNAVTHYLTKYPPPYNATNYNNSGNARGFPDVAALGIKIALVLNGTANNGGGGTSAAAPIVAGIVTLLNEARISCGKGPLGFLNPTFYANPDAFNDVTVGSNPGCGTQGFACQPGWDPVTGLGTPNFEKLKAVVLALGNSTNSSCTASSSPSTTTTATATGTSATSSSTTGAASHSYGYAHGYGLQVSSLFWRSAVVAIMVCIGSRVFAGMGLS